MAFVALSGVMVVQSAAADSKPQEGAQIGSVGTAELAHMCRRMGGTYSPPSDSGVYVCLLPTGSIVCDADGCTSTTSAAGSKLTHFDVFALNARLQLALKQSVESTPPDLVPLPNPGSIPPEGFCRRNDQGQLLVNVYNQGTTIAAASKTRLVFNGSAPTDVDTPTIDAGTTAVLVVSIPNSCFDANNNCSFTIGVDAENAVAESDEINNNAAGLCGPQFQ